MSARDTFEAYCERINAHDFDQVAPLIAEDAVFWFSDGTHLGIDAVRQAFEQTWAKLGNETYWVDDVRWIAEAATAAVALYRFHWRAVRDGEPISGSGRGTSMFALRNGRWLIVHEHLSGA